MNNEIKEILEEVKHLVEISDYKNHYHLNNYFEVEQIAKLLDYITNLQTIEKEYSAILSENAELENKIINLQEKINQYENPDDMTLFYMWLDTEAKDKMKQLQEENKESEEAVKYWQNQCDLRERTIDKAIEYITYWHYRNDFRANSFTMGVKENLLNILQGENNE